MAFARRQRPARRIPDRLAAGEPITDQRVNLPDWRPTLRRALDEDLPPVVLSFPNRELLRVRMATCYPLLAWGALPVDEHPHGPRHTGPPLDAAALAALASGKWRTGRAG